MLSKIGPDYEKSEIGVGDSIVEKAMENIFSAKTSSFKALIEQGTYRDYGEVALHYKMKQQAL